MNSNPSTAAVQCKLTGFPRKQTLQQIEKFLPSFVRETVTSEEEEDYGGVGAVVVRHHQQSTSVILTLPSRQTFKKLVAFVNANQYKSNNDGQHHKIFCGKYQWKKNDNKNIKKNNDTKKNTASSTSKRKGVVVSMARSFLEYVQNKNNDDRSPLQSDHNTDASLNYTYTRDEVSNLYKQFVVVQQEEHRNGNPAIISESRIMASLRKLHVIKTKRMDNHQYMVTFQHPNGTFPSVETQLENQSLMQLQMKQSEQNQEGIVSISQVSPTNPMASIGEPPITISFDINVESSVALKDVEFRGPHGNLFRRQGGQKQRKKAMSVVLEEHTTTTMEWTLPTPKKIGIWRARAHFIFEEFTIVRPIQVSCGYAKLQEVLQPVAPYERKARKRRRKAKTIVGAPNQTKKQPPKKQDEKGSSNPFKNLPRYTVPEEISDYIQADEFTNVMKSEMEWSHPVSMKRTVKSADKNEEEEEEETNTKYDDSSSSIVGYGKYWNHLLWASEYQNWRDIELYDIENAQLQKSGRYYLLKVPGLAEKRPSVLRGDLIELTLDDTLYLGRVIQTQQLTVQLEFDLKFASNFNPAIDRVHIRFKFSRTTFRTSHHACLEMAESILDSPLLMPTQKHVDEILDDYEKKKQETGGSVVVSSWANRNLNREQKEAVQQIVYSKLKQLPYIIFGPPGTGKTTTVVETVYQLAKKQKKRILVVAPSNDASDILVERLAVLFPPSELRRIIAYSRTLDSVPKSIRDYANEGKESFEQLEEIMNAKIVVATVNLAARFFYFGVPRNHFDVICVDEAGQSTEPEVMGVLASLMKENPSKDGSDDPIGMQQLVLAGDPKQLGPVTTSSICEKFGLSVSYMERLTERSVYKRREGADGMYPKHLLTKLVQNYRNHPDILKLPNEMFYDNDLISCANKMVTSSMTNWEHLPTKGVPLIFHSVLGANCREANSPSWFNKEEAQQIVEYVEKLTKKSKPPVQPEEIGVITPYARQAQKIRKALEVMNITDVKVGSVECFQGQERRVILLSTVRAEQDKVSEDLRYNLGFVANPRRFNVALTRAKSLLIVVGSPSVLSMDKDHWLPFLKYCHEKKAWAGEDWDPVEAEADEKEDDDDAAGATIDDDDSDNGDSNSDPDLIEDFVFINREE